ncbi:hypothetical protein QL093DRAFT_1115393 [Fusarium oxysporum]|nr:hypothetical protein QL093DRAFT_1115393 [Fusarium oxysporum]
MGLNPTVELASIQPDVIYRSPNCLFLRPHQCDNCQAGSRLSKLNHPLYCDLDCFDVYPSHIDSTCGPLTRQLITGAGQDHATCDDTPAVRSDRIECSVCANFVAACGFDSSQRTYNHPSEDNVGNWMFEEADITALVVQPLDSSTLIDTVTSSPPHRRADSDTLVDCDFLDGALEVLETSEHARLQELTTHNSSSWRPYEDLELYGSSNWSDDLGGQFFGRTWVTLQDNEHDELTSNEDEICYCGYCEIDKHLGNREFEGQVAGCQRERK